MREADRLECHALGRTPKDALRNGLRSSLVCLTAVVDGKPAAMLGVVPIDMMAGRGTIWMLGTDAVYESGRALLGDGPTIIAAWLKPFRRLENIVAVENVRAVKVLRRWGFEFDTRPQTYRGVAFLPFWKERAAIQGQALAA